MSDNETAPASNFIHEMIDGEIKTGKSDGRIVTRFPRNRTDTFISDMQSRSA